MDKDHHNTESQLSVEDKKEFRLVVEVLQEFNIIRKQYQRALKRHPHANADIWFVKLGEYNLNKDPLGINLLDKDGMRLIDSRYSNAPHGSDHPKTKLLPRIVFARSVDLKDKHLYRFVGIFDHSAEESDIRKAVFHRISDKVSLPNPTLEELKPQ